MILKYTVTAGRATPFYLLMIAGVLTLPIEAGCCQAKMNESKESLAIHEEEKTLQGITDDQEILEQEQKDGESARQNNEQPNDSPPRLFGYSNPPPPHYDELFAKANEMSEEELDHRLSELLERYRQEEQWLEFLDSMKSSKSKEIRKVTRWPDALADEHVVMSVFASSTVVDIAVELGLREELRRHGIPDSAPSIGKELVYAKAASWIDLLTQHRRRLSRNVLEEVYDPFNWGGAGRGGLDIIWDPSTDSTIELEDLLPADDESVTEVDDQSPANDESDL